MQGRKLCSLRFNEKRNKLLSTNHILYVNNEEHSDEYFIDIFEMLLKIIKKKKKPVMADLNYLWAAIINELCLFSLLSRVLLKPVHAYAGKYKQTTATGKLKHKIITLWACTRVL